MSDPNNYDLSSGLGVRLYPGAIQKVDGWKPAAPTELRPPPEHEGKPLHWIGCGSDAPECWKWDSGIGRWAQHGDFSPGEVGYCRDAHDAYKDGYSYLGPAEWSPVAANTRIAELEMSVKFMANENASLRALLSRVEDAPTDPVQADIDRTIDHLLNGRTTKDQRKGLNTATERAERVPAGDDAAVGRALR